MNKKQKIILFVVAIFFLSYIVYALWNGKEEEVEAQETLVVEEEPVVENYKVDIKGQVKKPGVYEVVSGSRVIDVIEKAGGLTKNANTDFLNLSKKVEDGGVIWVYTKKEIEKLKEGKTTIEYIEKECNCPDVVNSACESTNTNSGKVNINKATLQELMSLSGIGEAKAKAIIEYRNKTPFQTIEEIKKVSGIGDSAYETIKNSITV